MFKLKRLGLFPSLLTSVQVLGAEKLLSRSRKSDSVQFLYYRALYEFHGQKFKEAWDRFKDTWNLLHLQDWSHRRRVAIYMIAIALCHGKCPSNDFLIKYKLDGDLKPISDSILSGNSFTFTQELNNRADSLHNNLNIYVFLLLNAQPAIQLNLVKRTWKLAGKSKIITFEQIRKVAECMKLMEITKDELECILINLIGKVKCIKICSLFVTNCLGMDKRPFRSRLPMFGFESNRTVSNNFKIIKTRNCLFI